ncbi:MAG: C69 family dipeptidase, partial [Oscillospiraceae bacterium]|nr:C69 family dipeptidase [Oscillospiraceae bacterium]
MFYKRLLATLAALIIVLGVPVPAMASTLLYAGSDVTADGGTIFGRVEDTSPDSAKLFNVYPAGAHPKGEEYAGCYGFTWIYSHDSYGYTGFSDDNSQGICPDCGSAHPHTPHQAGGTNEKGLSVTATGILHQNDEIRNIDPYVKAGIDEAEITTILLGEAATAKDAMLLLTTIYNSYGARRGVSVLVADPMEAWYNETLSGTQFAAVRLNPALLMLSADVSAIGRIDLDDTENIVTSHALIETAVEAGTFVG